MLNHGLPSPRTLAILLAAIGVWAQAHAQFVWLESFTQNGITRTEMNALAPHPSGSCWVGGSFIVGSYQTSVVRYYDASGTRRLESIGSFGGRSVVTRAMSVDSSQNGYHFFNAYTPGADIHAFPIDSGISKLSTTGSVSTWSFSTGFLQGLVLDYSEILGAALGQNGKVYMLLGTSSASTSMGERRLIALELSETANGFQVVRHQEFAEEYDVTRDAYFYGGRVLLDQEGYPLFVASGIHDTSISGPRAALRILDWNPSFNNSWQELLLPFLLTEYPRVSTGAVYRHIGGQFGFTSEEFSIGVSSAVKGRTLAVAYSQVIDGNNYEPSISGIAWYDRQNPSWHLLQFNDPTNNFCFATAIANNGNIIVGGRRAETQPANALNRNVLSTGRAFIRELTPSGSTVRDIQMPIGAITSLHMNSYGDLLFAGSFVETNMPERMVSGKVDAGQTGYGWLSFGYTGGTTKAMTTHALTIQNGDDGDFFGAGFLGYNFAMGFHTTITPTLSIDDFDFRRNYSKRLSVAAPGIKRNDKYALTGSIQVVTQPAYGTLQLAQDGSFVYTRINRQATTDAFNYRIVKQGIASNTVSAFIRMPPLVPR